MSLLRECMADAIGVVLDDLGDDCVLTNGATAATTPVKVKMGYEVQIFEGSMLVGIATTGVFDRSVGDPRIGDTLENLDTGKTYSLDGIKAETATKTEFILGEN